ncbi:MAG: GerMN domain-containing protein, partial [Mycobacteriales bacterium]
CGVQPQSAAEPLSRRDIPLRLAAAPTASSGATATVRPLYFVRDGKLTPVLRTLPDQLPKTAVNALLAGPTADERSRGVTSALALARIDDVDVQGRVAIVRLGPSLGNGRTDQVDGIGQVVLTLIADPQIDAVQFQQNGQPLPVPTSEGALVSRPLSIADYQQLTT